MHTRSRDGFLVSMLHAMQATHRHPSRPDPRAQRQSHPASIPPIATPLTGLGGPRGGRNADLVLAMLRIDSTDAELAA